MSKRNIYVDKDQGPYVGDNLVEDLINTAAIIGLLLVACVLIGLANGWDIPKLLSLLGVK